MPKTTKKTSGSKGAKTQAISQIARLREETRLTQQKLATLIGVTTQTIQNWESGKSGVDQIEKFLKLCTVLGCELGDLIAYSEDHTVEPQDFSLDELRELRQKWLK